MILGILAHSGAGKDTLADHLAKKHDFVKIAFADPMKRFCRELFDFSVEQMWGPSESRNTEDKRYHRRTEYQRIGYPQNDPRCPKREVYLTPRYALQKLGTEWGRDCYEDIWAEYAMKIAKVIDHGQGYSYDPVNGLSPSSYGPDTFRSRSVVITDCRFKNEMAVLKKNGGKVIRLRRTGRDGTIAGGISGHASEEEQKSIPDSAFDYVLEVPEGLENYYQTIDEMMATLR